MRRRVGEGGGPGRGRRGGWVGRHQREMLLAMKIYIFFVAHEFSRGGFFFEGDPSQRSNDFVQDVESRETEGEEVGRILAGKEKGSWTVCCCAAETESVVVLGRMVGFGVCGNG